MSPAKLFFCEQFSLAHMFYFLLSYPPAAVFNAVKPCHTGTLLNNKSQLSSNDRCFVESACQSA